MSLLSDNNLPVRPKIIADGTLGPVIRVVLTTESVSVYGMVMTNQRDEQKDDDDENVAGMAIDSEEMDMN